MAGITLSWRHVNAWRLAQQGLCPRLPREELAQAAARCCGIQAQVMSAAEMAAWARVEGITAQDVRSALWQERTLLKTWAMRGTLHLLAASDLGLFVAARGAQDLHLWANYFAYYGFSQAQFEEFLAAAAQALSGEPMTREQLAAAVAEKTGSRELYTLVMDKSWGSPLKPLAWRGDLCFGPSQGQNVTFVQPAQWSGGGQATDPYAAFQEMARRYLRAYGPATVEEFAQWWGGGSGLTAAKKLFRSLADELETVEVEGQPRLALRSTLEAMQEGEARGTVNLLPLFDAYVMGLGRGTALEPLLPKEYQKLVYRPQGWVTAVVLVDGFLRGTWELKPQRAQPRLKVRLFEDGSPAGAPASWVREGIHCEAARLGEFLNTQVTEEYE
jgi:hypothetical protein